MNAYAGRSSVTNLLDEYISLTSRGEVAMIWLDARHSGRRGVRISGYRWPGSAKEREYVQDLRLRQRLELR